jgi:type IV secretion system protein VirB4
MTVAIAHRRTARRETDVGSMIPYSTHVDEHVVRTRAGDYVQTLQLSGLGFECADDEDMNHWHEGLNALWRNIASPHWAVWTHVVRRRQVPRPSSRRASGFAGQLQAHYERSLDERQLMGNELYLSLVYRPQPTAAGAMALGVLKRTQPAGGRFEMHDSLEECAKKRQEVLAALDAYDPRPLGLYREGPHLYSSLLEFYGLLVNAEWQRVPLPRVPLHEALATTRPLFGGESMEYRLPTATRLSAFLGIQSYPTPTLPGMFNNLLSAPFSFVLTQSFTFLPKATSLELMSRQLRRMTAAADLAVSQAEELKTALDDLASHRFVLGDQHFTLQVMAEPFDGVHEADGPPRLKRLNDHVAQARFLLSECGMTVAREDLALEGAFWGQLPGNFQYRTRKAPITSRNFAAMSGFHNHPTGRAEGNHWGEALATFVTSAHSPHAFSLHASDPRARDGGSRKDVGHIACIGPVGTGKTTLLGFLVAMLTRFGASQVVFDKDEGLHILIRGLGGAYLPLRNGRPTGCNPLQLDPTGANVAFLKQWLHRLVVRPGAAELSARQQEDVDHALHGTLALPRHVRRLSRLVEFLDPTDPEGVHARLRPWCTHLGGDLGWVFDNVQDDIVGLLEQQTLVGFDVTDFLDNPMVRDPMSMYLFHLVNRLVDGRRLVVWADEFAKLLADPSFANFSKDGLEGWRKKEAALCVFTQSASHVLDSSIARAIVEQTPTKIFFPNPAADHDEYTRGFNLTEREFKLVKETLQPGSRSFLIKQNHSSVVATLDLRGFDAELAVISGRTSNVELMKTLIEQHGPSPDDWLPAFMQAATGRTNTDASLQLILQGGPG